MKVTINNVEQLFELDRALYNQIKRYIGGDGIYRTNVLVDLPMAFAEAVKRFQDKNLIGLWDEQKVAEKRAEDKRQEAKDEAEAAERLKFWFSCGLIANDFNKDMFRKILSTNNARFCAVNVDVCVNQFRDKFQWRQVEAPPPPPPPPPPPELIPGTTEVRLPLNAAPSPSHSILQLQDWDRRKREERNRAIREANNALATANKPVALEVV